MKSLVRNSVMLFAMFTLTVATALANDPYLRLEKTGDKVITFAISKISSPVYVSFKDAEGSVVYSDTYKLDKPTLKKYSFEEMAEGDYYLEVETDVKVEKYLIVVDSKGAELYEAYDKVYHKPVAIAKSNRKVFVSKLNLSKDDLKISVYDEQGHWLCTEVVKGDNKEHTIGKRFNMTKVEKGEYTFFLTTDGKTYVETINL
ncbi:hypothetical protein [Abyssalbus ytuae]|uniref:Por secretion system C-terminal sorting domain-containing protein n=1 Tax=Abyssalbus ytuae TaxID=2926907 RepID=A0A9E6ZS99_9FLAO|nr:hypothetical protein [Abyssalbus ytuae]UOB16933.1 hypothetical protein MQE35_14485 [Abyssalbus ytuae]